jgi:hypothetical protein
MGNRSMILSTLEGSVTASWPYVNTWSNRPHLWELSIICTKQIMLKKEMIWIVCLFCLFVCLFPMKYCLLNPGMIYILLCRWSVVFFCIYGKPST